MLDGEKRRPAAPEQRVKRRKIGQSISGDRRAMDRARLETAAREDTSVLGRQHDQVRKAAALAANDPIRCEQGRRCLRAAGCEDEVLRLAAKRGGHAAPRILDHRPRRAAFSMQGGRVAGQQHRGAHGLRRRGSKRGRRVMIKIEPRNAHPSTRMRRRNRNNKKRAFAAAPVIDGGQPRKNRVDTTIACCLERF